jgi:hypothetical protein
MNPRQKLLNLMQELQPENFSKIENEISGLTFAEIVEKLKDDFASIDDTIQDRIRIQKGKLSSGNEFTAGLSFYSFNILDDEDENKKFKTEVNKLEQIDLLKSLMQNIKSHLNEYEENECILNKGPYNEGAAAAALSKGKHSAAHPEEVLRHVGLFLDKNSGHRLAETSRNVHEEAEKSQNEAEEKSGLKTRKIK